MATLSAYQHYDNARRSARYCLLPAAMLFSLLAVTAAYCQPSAAKAELAEAHAEQADAAEAPPNTEPAPAPAAETAPAPIGPTATQIMAMLQDDDIALQVGDMSATWRQLKPLLQSSPTSETEGAVSAQDTKEQWARATLQRLATRGMFLLEVRARNITITEEEKQAYMQELTKSLENDPSGMTAESYLAQFTAKESTLLELTADDAQKLVKFGNQMFALITIDDAEVEQRRQRDQGLRNMLKQQNEQRRQQLKDLLKDPAIKTDDGFARLARRHSEGTEARQGGELDMNFTREQMAEVNHLEEFTLQPGETSGIMETPTAFRIMRVLRAIPPTKDGEPERLRVAQMLFGKLPEKDISFEEAKNNIMLDRQRQVMDIAARGLTQRYHVSTPIFPQGLW
mgnify:CR=1 FL=1